MVHLLVFRMVLLLVDQKALMWELPWAGKKVVQTVG
jgi:hypothetical protein